MVQYLNLVDTLKDGLNDCREAAAIEKAVPHTGKRREISVFNAQIQHHVLLNTQD